MRDLAIGRRGRVAITVDESLTVPAVSSQYPRFEDMPPVFATAYMVGLAECAAMDALHPVLEHGESSVGIEVSFEHTAATPIGLTVVAEAEVTAVEGRIVTFEVTLHDSLEPIGKGTHRRAVILRDKFDERILRKAAQAPGAP